MAQWLVRLLFTPEDACLNPPWDGQTFSPHATTNWDLVTQHNGGSSMRWRPRYDGKMSGGQTVGGENNHPPRETHKN